MWATLLLSLAAPIVKRVLAALTIGVVSYSVSTTVFDLLIAHVQDQFGSLTGDVAMIVGLYGLPNAAGIILGAHSTSLSLVAIKKFGFL